MGSEYLGFVLFAVNIIALIWMHYHDKVKRALIIDEIETENNKVEIFKIKQRLEYLEDKTLRNDARVFIEKQKQDENIEFWYPNFKNKNK